MMLTAANTRAPSVSIPPETNSEFFFLSQPSKASSGRPKAHMDILPCIYIYLLFK